MGELEAGIAQESSSNIDGVLEAAEVEEALEATMMKRHNILRERRPRWRRSLALHDCLNIHLD